MKNKFTKRKNDIKTSYLIFSLITIVTVGFIIRLCYLPHGVPIVGDGLDYFSYAYQMAQTGNFPKDWALSNNGWPSFLSLFLSVIDADTFFENISIQRILSISISVLTTIPLFFLCNRFFNKTYSLIGASIFVFEPRIILNSTMGVIEPLYILVLVSILYFFLKNDNKTIYLSFILAGIFAILRWEGILLIFGIIGLFLIKNRHERKNILKLFLGVILFLMIVIPISYVNIVNTGTDGIITPFLTYGPGYIKDYQDDEFLTNTESENIFIYLITNGTQNTLKFLSWAMIPSFIIFLPLSLVLIIKNNIFTKWNSQKTEILIFSIILLLPAVYAFTRNFNDMRYLYVLFPIFSLISLVFVSKILDKNSQKKLISLLIILGIISISIIFLEQRLIDNYELEEERYQISKFIAENTDGINYSSFTKYLKAAELEIAWPETPTPDESGHLSLTTKKFVFDESSTLIEFIKENKENGLTHIITEDMTDRKIFLDVYNNPEKYPFLEKIYDGVENELLSKVKIFKINYEYLDDKILE